jgi:hypothetical protein
VVGDGAVEYWSNGVLECCPHQARQNRPRALARARKVVLEIAPSPNCTRVAGRDAEGPKEVERAGFRVRPSTAILQHSNTPSLRAAGIEDEYEGPCGARRLHP